jgi:hypothetical protein
MGCGSTAALKAIRINNRTQKHKDSKTKEKHKNSKSKNYLLVKL